MRESRYNPIHVNEYNILFHWDSILDVIRNHRRYTDGSSAPPMPITVEVNPMDFCNHGCVWCFTKSHRESDRMRENVLSLLLEQLKLGGVKSIHFAGGGESSLYKGLLPRKNLSISLADKLASDGSTSLGLITNGSVLDRLSLARLARLFTWIRFSIDAGTESRYAKTHAQSGHSLSHVHQNIANLIAERGNNIYPIIGCSFIYEENTDTIRDEVLRFTSTMSELGVDYIQVKPENDNRAKASLEFLDSLRDDIDRNLSGSPTFASLHTPHNQDHNSNYCWYSYFGTVVGATGGVYVCCYTYGQDEFKYGVIDDENDFLNLWSSSQRQNLADSIEPRKCPSCRHNTFNLLVERLYLLPNDIQNSLSGILHSLKAGANLSDVNVPPELRWLNPGLEHICTVINAGYNKILDFPVYRDTDFVGI